MPCRRTNSLLSVGCELTGALLQESALVAERKIDHLQVTIPNSTFFSTVLDIARQVPIVAHCNILNVLGENNWDEIAPIAKRIRELGPVHVVEHFTAFRTADRSKVGVWFPSSHSERQATVAHAIDSVRRWQDMIGSPLALENIPVVTESKSYFDALLEVKHRTSCLVVCDMPHLLLQTELNSWTIEDINSLCREMNPVQVHVAGIGVVNGAVFDDHRSLSLWVLQRTFELCPNTKFLTLEQSQQVPVGTLLRNLETLRNSVTGLTKAAHVPLKKAATDEQTNAAVRAVSAAMLGLSPTAGSKSSQSPFDAFTHKMAVNSTFDLLERYMPFIHPWDALAEDLRNTPEGVSDICRKVLPLAKTAAGYCSWWFPQTGFKFGLSIGQGGKEICKHEMELQCGEHAESELRRFNLEGDTWVELGLPKITQAFY